MKATLLELRRNPGKVLEAIENRQSVILTRRGKAVARIVPLEDRGDNKVKTQPAFGMWKDVETPVSEQVRGMRKGRMHDL